MTDEKKEPTLDENNVDGPEVPIEILAGMEEVKSNPAPVIAPAPTPAPTPEPVLSNPAAPVLSTPETKVEEPAKTEEPAKVEEPAKPNPNVFGSWSMREIQAANRKAGGHFLDPKTLKGFGERLGSFRVAGGRFVNGKAKFIKVIRKRDQKLALFDPETGEMDWEDLFEHDLKARKNPSNIDIASKRIELKKEWIKKHGSINRHDLDSIEDQLKVWKNPVSEKQAGQIKTILRKFNVRVRSFKKKNSLVEVMADGKTSSKPFTREVADSVVKHRRSQGFLARVIKIKGGYAVVRTFTPRKKMMTVKKIHEAAKKGLIDKDYATKLLKTSKRRKSKQKGMPKGFIGGKTVTVAEPTSEGIMDAWRDATSGLRGLERRELSPNQRAIIDAARIIKLHTWDAYRGKGKALKGKHKKLGVKHGKFQAKMDVFISKYEDKLCGDMNADNKKKYLEKLVMIIDQSVFHGKKMRIVSKAKEIKVAEVPKKETKKAEPEAPKKRKYKKRKKVKKEKVAQAEVKEAKKEVVEAKKELAEAKAEVKKADTPAEKKEAKAEVKEAEKEVKEAKKEVVKVVEKVEEAKMTIAEVAQKAKTKEEAAELATKYGLNKVQTILAYAKARVAKA